MERGSAHAALCCPLDCVKEDFADFDRRLYHGFTSSNPDVREKTFMNLEKKISSWLKGIESPRHIYQSDVPNGAEATAEATADGKERDVDCLTSTRTDSLLEYHFYCLFCLSRQCPAEDVREWCAQLLSVIDRYRQKTASQGGGDTHTLEDLMEVVERGASSFIPFKDIERVDNPSSNETKALFTEAYIHNNRVDHLTQILGFHPQYLSCFIRTQNRLIRADGPLPYTERFYIAIIAAARHHCTYLIHMYTAEYLHAGGDRKWLESLDHVPAKLRNLQEINRLLAHRPWMVSRQTIESLCRCGSNSWTMSELTHAIVLMAHFHSLSSAVFGCGLHFELDDAAGRLRHSDGESNSESDGENPPCDKVAVDIIRDRLLDLKEEHPTEEEGRRRFEVIELQTLEYPVLLHGKPRCGNGSNSTVISSSPSGCPKSSSSPSSCSKLTSSPSYCSKSPSSSSHCSKSSSTLSNGSRSPSSSSGCPKSQSSSTSAMTHLVDHTDFLYADFAKFKPTTPTFRASDYSWETHGFSIANRFYPDMGELLDDKFTVAKGFTYHTMGEKYTDVNTQDFRTGIWNYIHCILGIRHDDYDYGRVNSLLERGLKGFIKLMACYPERVSKKDFCGVMEGFTYSEKIHVNILMLEAKMQAELMYALRAVAQFMT